MSYRAAYNVLDRPVTVDDEGRTIGGGEWGVIDTTSTAGRNATDGRTVALLDPDTVDTAGGSAVEAVAALDLAAELNDRRAALAELSKADLEALAREHGLLDDAEELGDGDTVRKRDLVAVLTRRPYAAPAVADEPKTKTRRRAGSTEEASE